MPEPAGEPAEELAEELAARIDAMCRPRGWEWAAAVNVSTDCCWSCKLTVILTPARDDGPDRSLVTFACAGQDPADVLSQAWDDMQAWITELAAVLPAGEDRRDG